MSILFKEHYRHLKIFLIRDVFHMRGLPRSKGLSRGGHQRYTRMCYRPYDGVIKFRTLHASPPALWIVSHPITSSFLALSKSLFNYILDKKIKEFHLFGLILSHTWKYLELLQMYCSLMTPASTKGNLVPGVKLGSPVCRMYAFKPTELSSKPLKKIFKQLKCIIYLAIGKHTYNYSICY